jgi:hypothetical protein
MKTFFFISFVHRIFKGCGLGHEMECGLIEALPFFLIATQQAVFSPTFLSPLPFIQHSNMHAFALGQTNLKNFLRCPLITFFLIANACSLSFPSNKGPSLYAALIP